MPPIESSSRMVELRNDSCLAKKGNQATDFLVSPWIGSNKGSGKRTILEEGEGAASLLLQYAHGSSKKGYD